MNLPALIVLFLPKRSEITQPTVNNDSASTSHPNCIVYTVETKSTECRVQSLSDWEMTWDVRSKRNCPCFVADGNKARV